MSLVYSVVKPQIKRKDHTHSAVSFFRGGKLKTAERALGRK